jgi:hypothetical protein
MNEISSQIQGSKFVLMVGETDFFNWCWKISHYLSKNHACLVSIYKYPWELEPVE